MKVRRSLTRQMTQIAVSGAAAVLLLVAVPTACLLHIRAIHSLDQVLLAAATHAPKANTNPWVNPESNAPVRVRPWDASEESVPPIWFQSTLLTEKPKYGNVGDERVLLLIVEPPGANPDAPHMHPHDYVVASAPRVRFSGSAAPFLIVGGIVSVLALFLTTVILSRAIRTAMLPLDRASQQLGQIHHVELGTRLDREDVAEVDDVVVSINGLLERLEAAYDAQSRFTADAAHELRTPLAVLSGELELALRRPRTADEYRDTTLRAQTATKRLGELVQALMAYARVDAGQVEQDRAPEHISSIVTSALTQEKPVLDQSNCTFTVEILDDPELVLNAPLLTTALANLIRNAAIHATGEPVSIRVSTSEGVLNITVDDAGPGVDPSQTEAVFGRFSRSQSGGGLGLGLPLAREIARRHGGDVLLERSPEGGCRSRLVLPAPPQPS